MIKRSFLSCFYTSISLSSSLFSKTQTYWTTKKLLQQNKISITTLFNPPPLSSSHNPFSNTMCTPLYSPFYNNKSHCITQSTRPRHRNSSLLHLRNNHWTLASSNLFPTPSSAFIPFLCHWTSYHLRLTLKHIISRPSQLSSINSVWQN